ncbi:MAG: hypothetical protein QXW47_02680 [Candidatus Jordarchaeales archaeon]|nr:hypothetical protein [Candidatus Jordarchaeia archaeon]
MRAGVYHEKEVLQAGGFKEESPVNGLRVYVHEDAYDYLPDEVHVDYSGYWYKELRVTNYTPTRLRGTC